MIREISLLILLGLISAGGNAQSTSPKFQSTHTADDIQIVDAMKTFYIAATNDDLVKFHSVTSPNFYSFDGGKLFKGDSLMELIKGLHSAGTVFIWNVTEPEVHIEGTTAWITYVNKGSIQNSSGMKNMTWLESAVLRKDSGAWLIHFFHSTRVP
jgi:hypothetical protein